MKEPLTSLKGEFRWISHEPQSGDGLTKNQTRGLLADRLRHGRIKFVYNLERGRKEEVGSGPGTKQAGIFKATSHNHKPCYDFIKNYLHTTT